MNGNITEFLKKQTCATVCSADENAKPWCFSCYYVFDAADGLLYYKSSANTRHAVLIKHNASVAGTILPDKLNSLQVKGLQFEGLVLDAGNPLAQHAASVYYKKNPMAIAIPGEVFTIQLQYIKMTDSTLGFGKKLQWQREEVMA